MSLLFATLTLLAAGSHPAMTNPQNPYLPFQGEKSSWHDGFDRYDFAMDNETLAIAPMKRPENEGFGVGGATEKQSRWVVVCPKHPAPGNPWSWQGCYWDHQPQAEVELLRRDFTSPMPRPTPISSRIGAGTPGTNTSPKSTVSPRGRLSPA